MTAVALQPTPPGYSPTGEDLFTMLCERRGWNTDFLRDINSKEHQPLLDVDTMAHALEKARLSGLEVTIAPDFDMDGIASGVLGYAGLAELGFRVNLHLPDYRRGHDLTPEDIDEVAQRYPDTQVLLTCDGGVNSTAGIESARSRGWQTLVTDHHQELAPGCAADITVNPCRIDETYALRGICGAHVLYQVLENYTRTYQPHKLFAIRWLRLFAGLGTVSDVMPILYENRQLVRDSLSIARLLWTTPPAGPDGRADADLLDVEQSIMMQLLRSEVHDPVYVRAFEGFALALKAFTQVGKIRDRDDINEGFYGFYLSPAMNSPRRTGAPLVDCFQVFTGVYTEEKLAAMHRVIENNELRKQLVAQHTQDLHDQNQPLAPWVWFSHAPAGMLGLLASVLMRQYGHPVVVLSTPAPGRPAGGSARAPGWFDVITALEAIPDMYAIGHAQACGVRCAAGASLHELAQVLREATALAVLQADDQGLQPSADLVFGPDEDCDAPLTDLEPIAELVRHIETLRPFGHDFTRPVIRLALEPARSTITRMGSDGQHARVVGPDGLACLLWNVSDQDYDWLSGRIERARHEHDDAVAADAPIAAQATMRMDAALQLNTWNGTTRLQAVVSALVPDPAEQDKAAQLRKLS